MAENNIRIGIVGIGSRGVNCFGRHFRETEGVEITALCDPNPVRLEAARSTLGSAPKCYTTISEMCAREHLQGAVIASPDVHHEANALALLGHDVDLLVDKPLATSVKGCMNIIETARRRGRTVMIGFNLRHNPVLKRLKQIVDEGLLGRVFLIENREFYSGGKTYMSRWNRKREFSGGLWIHKGSHDFDVFNWLLGFPAPVSVSATAGVNVFNADHLPFKPEPGVAAGPTCSVCRYATICPDRYDISKEAGFAGEAAAADGYHKDVCMYLSDKDVHDNGMAIVEYRDGSRCSHLECFTSSWSDRQYTLVGDLGTAEVSLEKRQIVVKPRWSSDVVEYRIGSVEGGHGGADPGLVQTFLRVIRGAEMNLSTAEHGMMATMIGQAAEISWRERRMVIIDEEALRS